MFVEAENTLLLLFLSKHIWNCSSNFLCCKSALLFCVELLSNWRECWEDTCCSLGGGTGWFTSVACEDIFRVGAKFGGLSFVFSVFILFVFFYICMGGGPKTILNETKNFKKNQLVNISSYSK